MELEIDLTVENGIQYFKVTGEIDAYTAPSLKERLESVQDENGVQVELNLSGVSYMDSTGLGVFVGFYKRVTASEGQMKITGLNVRLKRLFEITGLDEVMEIEAEKGGTQNATI